MGENKKVLCLDKVLGLDFVWGIRLKLWDEGNKLWDEGDKLRAEGDKLWAEAIIAAYGNITIEWVSPTHCKLGNGEEFKDGGK